jgi:hypothetical protein
MGDKKDSEPIKGEVVSAKEHLAKSIREGFDKLTPTEAAMLQNRGAKIRKAKHQAKKLADAEAFVEAHKKYAGELLDAKVKIIRGLTKLATDPETGEFDPSRIEDKQIRTLLSAIEMFEKRGFDSKKEASVIENQLNVLNIVADIRKGVGLGES